MLRFRLFAALFATALLAMSPVAWAHFGVITPSDDIVTKEDPKTISLEVKFIHPMEMQYMEMAKPKRFGVVHKGKTEDLLGTLQSTQGKGPDQDRTFTFWKADFTIKKPGDYTFFMEPTPYWEPAEDKFIVHYTKVGVNALGLEEGWDKPVGLEIEIVPLTRPYGFWTGKSLHRPGAPERKAGSQCGSRGGIPQRIFGQQGHRQGPIRPLCDPGGQGGQERRVFLRDAAGRLVGLCRARGCLLETEKGRQAEGRRDRRRLMGPHHRHEVRKLRVALGSKGGNLMQAQHLPRL